jgi:hypothetical protein
MLTRAVAALGAEAQREILEAVRRYDEFDAILDERTVVILELGGCCSHWTVLYDVKPRTMLLLDSGYLRTLTRSHCTLGPSKTHYRLKAASRDRHQPRAAHLMPSC